MSANLAREGSKNAKLYPIHRLDRMTSGVVIFAKSSSAAKFYSEKLLSNQVQKTYIARVIGIFPDSDDSEISVSMPLRLKDPRVPLHECHEEGKAALTRFLKLGYDPKSNSSLVRARPITGRTHQIRLHLAHLGFPIVNDSTYGGGRLQWSLEQMESELKNIIVDPNDDRNNCEICAASSSYFEVLQKACSPDQLFQRGIWLHALRYQVWRDFTHLWLMIEFNCLAISIRTYI